MNVVLTASSNFQLFGRKHLPPTANHFDFGSMKVGLPLSFQWPAANFSCERRGSDRAAGDWPSISHHLSGLPLGVREAVGSHYEGKSWSSNATDAHCDSVYIGIL